MLLISTLSGCGIAPEYKRPYIATANSYTVGDDLVNEQQRLALGKELQTDWWSLFANENLNIVIQQALANNYTIATARETLAQAEEAVKSKRGALWPQVGINAAVSNQLYGAAFFGPSNFNIPAFTYYELGPTVNWNIDIFGATRYAIEQQKALALYQSYNLDAVYISLSSNVVNQALDLAAIKAQIAKIQIIIEEDQKTLELVKTKFEVGSATRLDVLDAQTRLDSDKAQIPALKQSYSMARNMLAVLVGRAPVDFSLPEFDFSSFNLPAELPLTLPSELVHKRPDILAAEANLHAAHSAVGVATANLYPSIVISGNLMQEALNLKSIFDGVSTAWAVAASLTQPLFNGGTLRAEKRKAEHAYKAALAQYKQTILIAFKQVADALTALEHDAETIHIWSQSVNVARESLALARESYAAGAANLLQLQDNQRALERAELSLILAQRQQFLDTTQLFVAIGGSPLAKTPLIMECFL